MRDSIVDAILELEEGDRLEIPFDTKKEAESLRTGLYRRFQGLPDGMKDDLHISITTLAEGKYKITVWRADVFKNMVLIKSTGEVRPVLSPEQRMELEEE